MLTIVLDTWTYRGRTKIFVRNIIGKRWSMTSINSSNLVICVKSKRHIHPSVMARITQESVGNYLYGLLGQPPILRTRRSIIQFPHGRRQHAVENDAPYPDN